jgi:metal-responsive CopG/Arc/MetJ family transcriptional regulator
MSRITLSLPDDLASLLRREAERRRTSVSGVARRAIEEYLHVGSVGQTRLPFTGIGRSGQRHVARDAEKILAAEWRDAGGG